MATEIQEMVEKGRKAMEQIKDYTQEQVDKLVYEGAKIIYKNAKPLAKMAVEETGLGYYEDKIAKNVDTAAAFWDYLRDKKSVGIIEVNEEEKYMEIAHPAGVIACITPATNPTVTPLGNFMHAIKCKDACIISPAPRAAKTSTKTIELLRQALVENGAPADLVQIVKDVTIAKSAELMSSCDLVIATGSSGLTKAAYSSGKPAYGVGPGNPPIIVDRGFDLDEAADLMFTAVGSDNGILCDGDNLTLYPEDEEKEFFEALERRGIKVFTDEAEIQKMRDAWFNEEGKLKSDLTGSNADVFMKAAGIDLPADTKVVAIHVNVIGAADPMNQEILGPIVSIKSYDTFENAVDMAIENMESSGGIGHTAGIFSNDQAHIEYYCERIPVARVLINQPTPDAWGPSTNALSPAVSEGCGTWGNNILCGNVDYKNCLNISRAVYKLDREPANAEELFAD
ncbi:MAG: aldehyde dehydrogenase family protein [Eubacteriales bacterium]|nr:aldehyde dehydrogenase family protein [Eubacteriales bacterium]